MKIISWNCSGGFRKKYPRTFNLKADILIIQECENPYNYPEFFKKLEHTKYFWEGENQNRGIGIFFNETIDLKLLNWSSEFSISIPGVISEHLRWNTKDLKQFLGVSISENHNLIAVWTKGGKNQSFRYIGQFWKYLLANKSNIVEKPTIIIGDFNSNSIWDKIDRWWNHTEIIKILNSWNYKSLYHEAYTEKQGEEKIPTFFLQRKKEKSYHIDYAFLPNELLKNSEIQLGKFEDWIDLSDHVPLIIEFEF
ncbi:endonuclease/exonuclease/phosphatase family protein [Leptospira vanthielii]|uniref:Endonuclease/exonuclease/phosphatase family protein n=1 Tax=Leptospira vanthielii serovar Holland str. Waz Holland = ATCC 700522 TaxID=1218591 RepID=N1WCQ3_9LEPT|nr:endonuclease/exonuclease/phosphatase family protein [Leptospira vanthielii]EMY71205.1 endonuclease/exonuclease/phosphatase family protein [Leptospira vanthielii serovar Holland str. Waz Holland = ATCC 700522]